MRRKVFVVILTIAMSAPVMSEALSPRASIVNNCLTAPSLSSAAQSQLSQTTGLTITKYDFAQGVSHDGPEATRVSVASASLDGFDLKIDRGDYPSTLDPWQYVTNNRPLAAVNAGFFDLSWSAPYSWGPVIRNDVVEYFPLARVNGWYEPGWLGVVGITTHPQTTGGYAAKGSVQSSVASMTTHAVNFTVLPASAAVVFDPTFSGLTPKGDATLVVSNGVVTAMHTAGKSVTVPADGFVVQATGKHADNVRLFPVHPSATLPTADVNASGYTTTTSTITIGTEKITVNAVNLSNQPGNAFFNSQWTTTAPARSMTFVFAGGKVSAVYATGKAIKPSATSTVLQVTNPSANVKKLKVGAKVTLAIKAADLAKGIFIGGKVSSNGVAIAATAVNKAVTSPAGALLFNSSWTSTTTAGAVTLVVKSGVVTKFFTNGSAIKPATGETVIQVPAALAATARQMSADTTVQVNPGTSNKIERSIQTGSVKMNGSFVSGAVTIPILAVNFHVIAPGSATAFTHDFLGENWDHVTPAGAATVIVKNNVITAIYPSGSWYSVTDPAEYVLQISEGFASQISQLTVGAAAAVNLTYTTKGNADLKFQTALGRGATNLHLGVNTVTCNDYPPYVRPRTAIGWNTTGKFWIITTSPQVDTQTGTNGYRTGGSTVHQVGDWLKQLGATEAVSFDGGGSTFMLRSSSTGTHRVDMSDPNGSGQPWIRSAPIMLLVTTYVAP